MTAETRHPPVARRWAEALRGLAAAAGATDAVRADLEAVTDALRSDPELAGKFFHPLVVPAVKRSLADSRLLEGRHPLVANLVRLLIARRREGLLRCLSGVFGEAVERAEGIVRARVDSAFPVDPAGADAMQKRIEAATRRRVVLETRHAPELIGGVRLIVGDRLLDGSVAAEFARIRGRLLRTDVR